MKAHENVPIWGNVILKQTLSVDAFTANLGVFPEYFRRILAMTSVTSMSFVARRLLLSFVIYAFQSLDIDFVKKELAPLAQIHIWAGLSSEERRNDEFEKHPPLRKFWKGSLKRYDSAGTEDVSWGLM